MRLVLALVLVLAITMMAQGSEEQLKIVNSTEVLDKIIPGNPLKYDNNSLNYDNCSIKGDLSLRKLEVKKDISFKNTTFLDSVYISSTKFSGIADFSRSTFNGDARFCDTTFDGDAYFSYSTFKELAFFENSTFNGDADIFYSTFNDNARFCNSTFKGAVFLENSIFNGDADFDYSTFKEYASFKNVTFKDKLRLTGTSYNVLSVRWNNIKKCLIYDDSVYLELIKNFKNLGYFEDSDNCYFQYRKDRRGESWPCESPLEEPARKFIDFLAEWSYGYGTRPANPFIGSLLLILLFGFAWRHLGFNSDRKNEKDNTVIDEDTFPDTMYSKNANDELNWSNLQSILVELKPFGFSAAVFLSGTWFLIDAPDIPDMPERSKHLAKHIFSLERILGAIFTSLFLLAISRTVIRAA